MSDYQLGILVASVIWSVLWVINHFRVQRAWSRAMNKCERAIIDRINGGGE